MFVTVLALSARERSSRCRLAAVVASRVVPDPAEIDWRVLSPRGRAILQQIAVPISAGFSNGEVAERLGVSPERIGRLLREVRQELRGEVHECAGGCGRVIADCRGTFCSPECRRDALAAREAARSRPKSTA